MLLRKRGTSHGIIKGLFLSIVVDRLNEDIQGNARMFNFFDFFVRIQAKLNLIIQITQETHKQMVTRAEFNNKLDEVVSTLTLEMSQIQDAIEAKVPEEIDLTPEFERLTALSESIKAIIPDAVPTTPLT